MEAAPAPSRPPQAEIADLVFQVADRIRHCFNTAAASLDLPPAQAQALARIDFPARMRHLAAVMACDASNVTGIVDGLERRGLVVRRSDPHDRRVKLVVLTEEGLRRRQMLHDHFAKAAVGVFDLPPDDQRTLRDLLARVITPRPGCAPALPDGSRPDGS